jgi:hypothetical protein
MRQNTRMTRLLPLLSLLTFGCGGGEVCPAGQVRRDGVCEPYVADDPVPSTAWRPATGTTWQWQLSGGIDTTLDVEMYDVDLFDVPDETLETLRADGRVVICYFSAGSLEDWREDAADIPEAAVGRSLDGWAGEYWLDVTDAGVRAVMEARLDHAVARGCDGVEPDNVDGYANDNGVGLNATEQLDYNRFLADAAHTRGLSVGLKNDLDQVSALVEWFDWALNEECAAFEECGLLADFTDAGLAVFHTEYVDDWSDAADLADEVCGVAPGLSTLIKTWDLGAEYLACP